MFHGHSVWHASTAHSKHPKILQEKLKSLNEFESYLNSAESSQSYKCPFESTKSGDARSKLFPRQTLFPDVAKEMGIMECVRIDHKSIEIHVLNERLGVLWVLPLLPYDLASGSLTLRSIAIVLSVIVEKNILCIC